LISKNRWAGLVLGAMAALLACGILGCSGKQQTNRSEFWLDAVPDPQIQLDPSLLLAGEVTQVTLRGVLVDHRVAFETVADYSLEIMNDDGETSVLHYAVGGGQRIPVERGEMVWVTVWQKRRPPQSAVRALRVEVWRPADFLKGRRLLAMVQANELVPEASVPAELRRLGPSTEVSYQTAERVGGTCVRAVVHRQFEQTTADTVGAPQGSAARRTLPPGSRLTVLEGLDRFELLLIDHREVIGGDCPQELSSYWAWSAVYQPPPAGTRGKVVLRDGDAAGGSANPGLQNIPRPPGKPMQPLKN
jgi:hypothetical protein